MILIATLAVACELFTTRNPEEPDTGKGSFVPPTSPQLVIDNLLNSIKEKNPENYIACLSDSSSFGGSGFVFYPAADALARYPGLFNDWNLQSERRWLVSLFSIMLKETAPLLIFKKPSFEVITPDSAVYLADYTLTANHQTASLAKEFSGRLVFTITPRTNGLWSITRWTDSSLDTDSLDSWSVMKARFFN